MSSNTAQFAFEFLDVDYRVSVLEFQAAENLSEMFGVTMALVSDELIPCEDVVRQEGVLTIVNPYKSSSLFKPGVTPDRYFHGVLRKFRYSGMKGRFHLYEAQLVPSLWLLSLKQNCRIFQDMKLQDIVAKILEEHDITSDQYAFRLKNEDIFNKFNIQYNETDLHFISRLVEKEGIFYFFEHFEDKHVLVFCDTEAFYRDIAGDTSIQLNSGDGLVSAMESIFSFEYSEHVRSKKYRHTNYNFKTPSLKLETDFEGENSKPDDSIEVYTYPGSYGEPKRGGVLPKYECNLLLHSKKRGEVSAILYD